MKKDGNGLLLDSGDILFAPQGMPDDLSRAKARLLLDCYREMGYAALGIGTTDLAASPGFLAEEASKRDLVLISANLRVGEAGLAAPYRVFQAGGLMVGVVAVTGPWTPRAQTGEGAVQVLGPEEALAKLIPGLRERSDLVVLLSDLGDARDRLLAKDLQGIDVIIGSGPGWRRSAPLTVGKTHLLRTTDSKGKSIGRAIIRVGETGEVLLVENGLVTLEAEYPADQEVLRRVHEVARLAPGKDQDRPLTSTEPAEDPRSTPTPEEAEGPESQGGD